jgi:dienelactone hydrolase
MQWQSVVQWPRRVWRWITWLAGVVKSWWVRQWQAILPGPEVRRPWILALLVLTIAWTAFLGHEMRFGFGAWLDGLTGAALGTILFFSGGGVLWLALRLVRWLLRIAPTWPLALLIATVLLVGGFGPSPFAGWMVALAVAGMASTLVSLARGGFRTMALQRKIATVVLLALTAAFLGAATWLCLWRGFEKDMADAPLSKQPKIAALTLPDPSKPGPFRVIAITYGPGTDRHRPEYGRAGLGKSLVKSRTVDGSKIFKGPESWHAWLYKRYWGFDMKSMPLNARVWYPDGTGPFPLVLCVHGNHLAQEFSDPGYAYLGELLASRGYIFASIDENFINSSWTDGLDQKETAARGWLLLEHLKLFREWNGTKDHRFEGKIDLDRIALMGHSRGGEAVATAAAFNHLPAFPGDATQKFDYNFHIRSLIAIAPADGQYKPAGVDRPLKDVNYFVIHGGYDGDVSAFDGSRQFNRTTFSDGYPGFKAELWIYRANHGQFNTVWGDDDNGPPGGWLLDKKPLLAGEEQRRIAKIYFSAFLETTLQDREEYRALFRDYRAGANWLPDTTYVNRYADATREVVAGFDEDFNVETATLPGARLRGDKLALWKEQRTELRWGDRGDNAVYLGWREPAATYTLALPAKFARRLKPGSVLSFDLADTNDNPPDADEKAGKDQKKDSKKDAKKDQKKRPAPIDIDVELLTADGKTTRLALSSIGPTYKPFHVEYVKFAMLGFGRKDKDTEAVLQRYAVRLDRFPGLASAEVREVRFRFDRTKEGVVVVDNVGFESLAPEPGGATH